MAVSRAAALLSLSRLEASERRSSAARSPSAFSARTCSATASAFACRASSVACFNCASLAAVALLSPKMPSNAGGSRHRQQQVHIGAASGLASSRSLAHCSKKRAGSNWRAYGPRQPLCAPSCREDRRRRVGRSAPGIACHASSTSMDHNLDSRATH